MILIAQADCGTEVELQKNTKSKEEEKEEQAGQIMGRPGEAEIPWPDEGQIAADVDIGVFGIDDLLSQPFDPTNLHSEFDFFGSEIGCPSDCALDVQSSLGQEIGTEIDLADNFWTAPHAR